MRRENNSVPLAGGESFGLPIVDSQGGGIGRAGASAGRYPDSLNGARFQERGLDVGGELQAGDFAPSGGCGFAGLPDRSGPSPDYRDERKGGLYFGGCESSERRLDAQGEDSFRRKICGEGGSVSLIVVLALALLGGGAYASKRFGWFDQRTKEAQTSQKTTDQLVKATDNQGGAAAAYVATIGATNAQAPDSKEKTAIAGLVPIALSYLPEPDPKKLLEAEKLKNAYLTGQLTLASNLTASALSEAAEARKETLKALTAKRASDEALLESAKEANEANADRFLFMIVAGAAGVLYLWTKLTHISPGQLSNIVSDIRKGANETNTALQAIDVHSAPLQQMVTRANVWLSDKLTKLTT